MTPKRAAAYAAAIFPILAPPCSGVAIKVDIVFNAPEERVTLPLYRELPEMVQSVLANDVGEDDAWEFSE